MTRDSFDPEWLTLKQVCELTQLSYSTVYRAVHDRQLRATQLRANQSYRVHLEDYDAWMRGLAPTRSLPQRHITKRSA